MVFYLQRPHLFLYGWLSFIIIFFERGQWIFISPGSLHVPLSYLLPPLLIARNYLIVDLPVDKGDLSPFSPVLRRILYPGLR